ncbi:ABC transporter ATP-binding protein [Rhizobium sp. L1K21]|uniref:ABC transporter ATP-binding protein n=1 Tax=Rhizobium sp. L1K21 TaxID=2954933 RepID=UPI00209329AF|nr:ATP-binding cassette domain-containing protein [Rhizobium sp. L1K21]MCO6188247.1 ATP-binding cassette domain-containing protein [Rhizobium sp. L1K21]
MIANDSDDRVKLSAANLSVGWGGRAIIESASFAVDFSTFNRRIPIVGRTGSGKTTLLYALAGQARPMAGEINWTLGSRGNFTIGNQKSAALSASELRRHHFSFAFQDAALVAHLTVRENVALPLQLADKALSYMEIRERVDGLIAQVLTPLERVGEIGERFPSQLSGGQRQRMAFAQAIATDPAVLFSDEPTGSLDPDTRREINRCVNRWIDGAPDRAFVWITHHNDAFEFEEAPYALQLTSVEKMTEVETVPSTVLFARGGMSSAPAVMQVTP